MRLVDDHRAVSLEWFAGELLLGQQDAVCVVVDARRPQPGLVVGEQLPNGAPLVDTQRTPTPHPCTVRVLLEPGEAATLDDALHLLLPVRALRLDGGEAGCSLAPGGVE